MSDKRLCPMRSFHSVADEACVASKCRWWVEVVEECGLTVLAQRAAAEMMSIEVKELDVV